MTKQLPTVKLRQTAEQVIVAMAINGDLMAFEELVRRRQALVRHFLIRLCADRVLADDLAQQVFLQAWRSIHKLKTCKAYGAWLKKISINVWLQQARKQPLLSEFDQPLQQASATETKHGHVIDLNRALMKLPNLMRLCIVLAYHEGMSHREITRVTGLPLGTVKSHIQRGSIRLREWLLDYR